MLVKKLLYITILTFLVVSCKSNGEQTEIKDPYSKVKAEKQEETIQINKDMLDVNRDIVEKYIARHNWEMTETESGLLYMIYAKTSDTEVKSGDIVEFSFKTSLLNGDVLYDSDATGNRKMTIDRNLSKNIARPGRCLSFKPSFFIFERDEASVDAHISCFCSFRVRSRACGRRLCAEGEDGHPGDRYASR